MQPTFITGNTDKVCYLSKVLGIELPHIKLDLDEIQSLDPKEVIQHKAEQAFAAINRPVLVEDTSLVFKALHNLPGTFIKFFIEGESGLEKMCRMLDGFTDRSAYATVIYGYFDGQEMQYFEGRLDGQISDHPKGEGGYGWDPIFIPDGYNGLTRAELSPEDDLDSYIKFRDISGLRNFLQSLQ